MSGDILDTIDGALADWELSSPDAMRWVPEQDRSKVSLAAERRPEPVRFYSTPDQQSYGLVQVAPADASPYAESGWTTIGYTTEGFCERAERGPVSLAAYVRPAVEAWQQAVRRLSRAAARTQADYALMPPPPSDPRERALQARRNRYTGPQPDRLDGRRRRG